MSESTIDMDRCMQGVDDADAHKQQITWTKCSEKMPPDDVPLIINDIDGGLLIKAVSPRLPKELSDRLQWAPYTSETWKELNK